MTGDREPLPRPEKPVREAGTALFPSRGRESARATDRVGSARNDGRCSGATCWRSSLAPSYRRPRIPARRRCPQGGLQRRRSRPSRTPRVHRPAEREAAAGRGRSGGAGDQPGRADQSSRLATARDQSGGSDRPAIGVSRERHAVMGSWLHALCWVRDPRARQQRRKAGRSRRDRPRAARRYRRGGDRSCAAGRARRSSRSGARHRAWSGRCRP